MLAREELPVELCLLLFGPQAQDTPGDDLDLLHPAMSTAAQHHDIGEHVVPLMPADYVVLVPSQVSAAVQHVAQLAEDDILGVNVQQSLVSDRHHSPPVLLDASEPRRVDSWSAPTESRGNQSLPLASCL
jgi:hypothetical protein